MSAFPPPMLDVETAVRAALAEDFGRAGDITSAATIPAGRMATAILSSREAGVLCGLPFAQAAFRLVDPEIRFEAELADGAKLRRGSVVARVSGPALGVLSGERVALNYLMHLSGIATATAAFVAKVRGTRARIADTRKTVPGMRAFAKYAVRCGGGVNHRFGLDDAILIKDNHIAVAGGVAGAVHAARSTAGHLVKVEVEVTSLAEFDEALAAGPDVILLDNMDPDTMREAVARNAGRAVLEASGGVSLSSVAAIAATGVDIISTSKITLSAAALDLGLDVVVG
ncbi:MAG: carboxylating nicotinate-nucleotide diphosphorylase [Rhizobiaceae bacterium]